MDTHSILELQQEVRENCSNVKEDNKEINALDLTWKFLADEKTEEVDNEFDKTDTYDDVAKYMAFDESLEC